VQKRKKGGGLALLFRHELRVPGKKGKCGCLIQGEVHKGRKRKGEGGGGKKNRVG